MPQFPPKTHPARDHLIAIGRRYPNLWAACDKIRAEHQQPEGVYLSDRWGAAALVEALRDKPDELERLQSMSALDVVRKIVPITTLACWRMTQGIYRIDPAMYGELIETPLTGEIPAEILLRLPEWCIYVETPGLDVYRFDGRGKEALRGAFARVNVDDDGRHELVLTLDMPAAPDLEAQSIPLRGNLDTVIDEAISAWMAPSKTVRQQIRHYVDPIINLLLYIGSSSDIRGKREQPGNPSPVRARRGGWRVFAADGPTTWDVGVRMGAALRAAYHAEQVASGSIDGHARRPHVRRAHWHGFLSGPRKREDGSEIPASQRRFDLRWLPPIPVNLPDVDALPAVIRRVE